MPRCCHFLFVNLLVYLILPAAAMAQVIIGPGLGGDPEVQLIEPGGTRTFPVFYPSFRGGITCRWVTSPATASGHHRRRRSGRRAARAGVRRRTDLGVVASFMASTRPLPAACSSRPAT